MQTHVSLESQAMEPRMYLEAEVQEDSQGCTDREILHSWHAGEPAQRKRHHLCSGAHNVIIILTAYEVSV